MPRIHHAQQTKAERLGFTLANTEKQPNYVEAFKADYNLRVYGVSAVEAIAQMEAALSLLTGIQADGGRARLLNTSDPRLVNFEYGGELQSFQDEGVWHTEGTPHQWKLAYTNAADLRALEASDLDNLRDHDDVIDSTQDMTSVTEGQPDPEFQEDAPRRLNGIPTDGAVAYREGIMTADCPFEEGSDDADAWYTAWDEAADAAEEQKSEDKGGSVVKDKFRARYAEMGHPTHCGDWLATYLNNLCVGDKHTDLALFEAICALNGVDTSKYRREGIGWQGRIRMTGRNLLAKKVYAAEGQLILPETLGGMAQAPAEWLNAQRFKAPKA